MREAPPPLWADDQRRGMGVVTHAGRGDGRESPPIARSHSRRWKSQILKFTITKLTSSDTYNSYTYSLQKNMNKTPDENSRSQTGL